MACTSTQCVDLYQESCKKKKCYCLKGTLGTGDLFGPWDHRSLEVSDQRRLHVCCGNFMLANNKLRKAKSKPDVKPNKKGLGFSLGYLSRVPTSKEKSEVENDHSFYHFESPEEHIQYYREKKMKALSVELPSNYLNNVVRMGLGRMSSLSHVDM